MEELEKRKKRLLESLKGRNWLIYGLLAFVIWLGYYIRTRNLPLLQDKYPLALDPYVFLRYAQHILDNGKLMAVDYMRNYPLGFNVVSEVPVLPHVVVYLYKIMHFFNPATTLAKAHILYPPISFVIGLFFFFLLVRKIFDNKIALLATTFLAIVPPYLHRTMAGFSDKEALATTFFFMAMYFYVTSLTSKNTKKNIIFSSLTGLFVGLTGLVWGGVSFLFLTIGLVTFLRIIINKFTKADFYSYLALIVIMVPTLTSSARYDVQSLAFSFNSGLMFVCLIMGTLQFFLFKLNLFQIKNKIERRIPSGIFILISSITVTVIYASIFISPGFIPLTIKTITYDLFVPLKDRWALTVAESHEPYITDWIGNFGWKYIWLFIIGSIVLLYEVVPIKKYKLKLTGLYTLFILPFIFSRYSPHHSILNGNSALSKFFYLGTPIVFISVVGILYLYLFYKDKETFNDMIKVKQTYLFMLIWFFIMTMGARRAIRLVFIYSPVTAILAAYLIFQLASYASTIKKDSYKIVSYVFLVFIVISPFTIMPNVAYGFFEKGIIPEFMGRTISLATYTGPSFNVQWQKAMEWVKENTPEDSVFAHWWDYGYWVQTGGNRTTITDGGNFIGYWNYLMGRHVLTGQSDMEALKFLYAHDASYLLMVSDEIGKYPAFSSIGSDENYDRYSWIPLFNLDMNNIQETRSETIYLYSGGTSLDDDFVYEGKLFPKQASGIGGFFVPISNNETQKIEQPTAILFYNNQQVHVPLNCIFINNEEIVFEKENGLEGCLRIIPKIEGQKMTPIGAALYMSPDVRKGRFGQLYLLNKKSKYFELVHNDENEFPLASYNGRMVGPLKIWKINYPKGLEKDPIYLQRTFPNPDVQKI